jgi:hypothetical protein
LLVACLQSAFQFPDIVVVVVLELGGSHECGGYHGGTAK